MNKQERTKTSVKDWFKSKVTSENGKKAVKIIGGAIVTLALTALGGKLINRIAGGALDYEVSDIDDPYDDEEETEKEDN